MQLTSKSLQQNAPIPATNAMGVAAEGGAQPSANRSPHLAWSGAPATTRSFVVLCVDQDAPTQRDDANRPDRTVPYDFPRGKFVHWVLVDIPASVSELSEGLDADGIKPRGKPVGRTPHGVRGLNDYTKWFAGDPDMDGKYAGYDGPWPPFNDERIHRYVFTLYALDIESLGLSGEFGISEARKAMEGHILAETSLLTTYAINPTAR